MVSTREISIPGPHPPPSLMTTWCAWRGHGARRRPRPWSQSRFSGAPHSRLSASWEHAPSWAAPAQLGSYRHWERKRKCAERKAGLKLTPCGDDAAGAPREDRKARDPASRVLHSHRLLGSEWYGHCKNVGA